MLNNGTLGFVELEMKAAGMLDTYCDLQNPNFCRHGHGRRASRACGLEHPSELKDALTVALSHDGPAPIDVVSARQELVMPPKTTITEARSFSLFMLKAVMDGRAHQLIDLARTSLTR